MTSNTVASRSRTTYKSLQACRAVAALLVMLFHLGGTIAAPKYFGIAAFSRPFLFGDAGVAFFFVLSGFIIMTAHWQDLSKPGRLGSYLFKRLTRIYPTYWIVFIGVWLLARTSTELRGSVPNDPSLILRSLLLVPQDASAVGGTGAPVLIVAWTLQYELVFYVSFAMSILSRPLGLLTAVTLLLVYIAGAFRSFTSFPLTFLSEDCILLFALGLAVAWARTTGRLGVTKPLRLALFGATCLAVLAADTVLAFHLFSTSLRLLYGVASGLIILGLASAEDAGVVIGGHPFVQHLGDASYALYLIHFPLISLACKLSMFMGLASLGVAGAVMAAVAIAVGCVGAAVGFHRAIEAPLLSRLRRLQPAT